LNEAGKLEEKMPNNVEGIMEKVFQKKQNRGNNSVNNKSMDVKNKNKEMYWGNSRNVAVAHSAHSVPIVSHSPTLQDIPEESEEYSEDDVGGLPSTNYLTLGAVSQRIKHRPALSTHVVFESNLCAKDTSSTNLSKPQSKADNTEESEKSIDILDKEFTDLIFLQFHILKKTLKETKEKMHGVEDKLELTRKENDVLKDKLISFQNQEQVMIVDRRDLSTQLVVAREKVIQLQSQLKQQTFKENCDLCQQSQKLQDENSSLKKENDLRRCKLENCQNTIKKMMEENSSLKKSEKILNIKGEAAETEINRLVIDLAVWKQKAQKTENSSAASSFISEHRIENESNLLAEKKLKPTTSYVEIISSTPISNSPTTATTVHYETVTKNKAITVIKEAADSFSNTQRKLPDVNESQKPSQYINRGIENLLVPEIKESVMSRTDTTTTLSDRVTVLEKKIQPIMDLVDNLQKSQHQMGKELDQRLSHSISMVTNQIISLREVLEKVQSQLSLAATPRTAPSTIKTIPSNGRQTLENGQKKSSKSNIPVPINRKSC